MVDRWRSRRRTAEAIAALCKARLLIRTSRFDRWSNTLGFIGQSIAESCSAEAARLAGHVEWASRRVPFSTSCLTRAMALSWMLRSRGIEHALVFAVRPPEKRGSDDKLHAWVEIAGQIILGNMPGPWAETLRLGSDCRAVG